MARDNKTLGSFVLTGIPPAPRGTPQIEVAFEIDVNGILKVAASDKGTGREQILRITNTGGLSASEVERMRQEAEMFAEQDRKRLELIELKNQAENLLHSYLVTLRDNKELITEEFKFQADEKVAALKAAFADPASTLETIQQRLQDFQQTLFALGASVYEQANRNTNSFSTSGMSDTFTPSFGDDDGTYAVDYEAIEE
jgi:molecular chaperone DnaK